MSSRLFVHSRFKGWQELQPIRSKAPLSIVLVSPFVGQQHPALPFAICNRCEVIPLPDVQAVNVRCSYRWPRGVGNSQIRIEFGSTLRQVKTGYTYGGDRIKVLYNHALSNGNNKLEVITPEITRMIPFRTIKFTKFPTRLSR